MGRSSAARFGRLAEEKAREKYNLAEAHTEWRDAIYSNGVPVNVKATKKNGDERFVLWQDDHHKLASQQGYYVFVYYTPRGSGIETHSIKRVKATRVTDLVPQWNDAGLNHKRKRQRRYKLPVRKIV